MNHNINYYFNYYVIFKSSGPNLDGPIISYSNAEAIKVNNNGTMHLFDEDMYETLDAVEYLMHLPRNIYDVYNMDEGLMSSSYDTPHDITILPDFLVTKMRFRTIPTMFVVTKKHIPGSPEISRFFRVCVANVLQFNP